MLVKIYLNTPKKKKDGTIDERYSARFISVGIPYDLVLDNKDIVDLEEMFRYVITEFIKEQDL